MEIGERLRKEYGAFQNIPFSVLEGNEFGMVPLGKEYVIFREIKSKKRLLW